MAMLAAKNILNALEGNEMIAPAFKLWFFYLLKWKQFAKENKLIMKQILAISSSFYLISSKSMYQFDMPEEMNYVLLSEV